MDGLRMVKNLVVDIDTGGLIIIYIWYYYCYCICTFLLFVYLCYFVNLLIYEFFYFYCCVLWRGNK
jgi:hypothetical protein